MKKLIFLALWAAIVLAAGISHAAGLEHDPLGNVVQTFAPDGLLSRTLTVNKTSVDLRGTTAWEIYTPTACKYWLTQTSGAAGTELSAPANGRLTYAVSRTTPFLNLSGCTSGEFKGQ